MWPSKWHVSSTGQHAPVSVRLPRLPSRGRRSLSGCSWCRARARRARRLWERCCGGSPCLCRWGPRGCGSRSAPPVCCRPPTPSSWWFTASQGTSPTRGSRRRSCGVRGSLWPPMGRGRGRGWWRKFWRRAPVGGVGVPAVSPTAQCWRLSYSRLPQTHRCSTSRAASRMGRAPCACVCMTSGRHPPRPWGKWRGPRGAPWPLPRVPQTWSLGALQGTPLPVRGPGLMTPGWRAPQRPWGTRSRVQPSRSPT